MFKTPREMKCMKWPLLVSNFWCSALDFSFGTLSTPYIFHPHAALFGCGILNIFNIPLIYLMVPGIFVIISIKRSSVIDYNIFKIRSRKTKLLYYAFNYLLYAPVSWFLFQVPKNQEAAKLETLKFGPCPTREFFTEPAFVVFSSPILANFVVLGIAFYVTTSTLQVLFFVGCSVYYLYLTSCPLSSPLTRKYQSHFFIGITVQAIVPLSFVTYGIAITCLLLDRLTQGVINMCIVTVGIHGLAESLAIILVHGPYREFVMSFLKRKHKLQGMVFEFSCFEKYFSPFQILVVQSSIAV
ncbi:LOW QUALITY PROTEIN: Protein CBR-SRH-92 [Caenorhabditis briggsae]|uniref:Protein CBR-SRH-92 n=1 Tax=Caenorhabditis briggsae TaxID=6238 RepID=A8Y0X3_CAEBR|nr:LOW QUALITY PROTEIN: Protein CBR-SRH-92 [Caenorhabditis briggsae]CAP38543.2 Protein CBR-SRH-92 [Caenorhabditis briggsae]